MLGSAICLRNLWFEGNGTYDNTVGGDLNFEGVRSVRIDDTHITRKIQLVDSSVNLYNCRLDNDQNHYIDEKSSLVAYEHRYMYEQASKIFVNSISYDGSQDILQNQPWQSTSVWGPLRCMTSTRNQFLVSEQFDTIPQQFTFLAGGTGTIYTNITSDRVLGTGSGHLNIAAGVDIQCDNVIGTIGPDPIPKYIVWSIHTYLDPKTPPPPGVVIDELYGEIKSGRTNLGHVYFKYGQWACSYGMKLVDISSQLNFQLHIKSSFFALVSITDYQILAFDDLASANAFVNSREFCIGAG